MKNLILSFALFLVVNYAQATILRVNNHPYVTGANVYTNAQAAHDAATSGDTIHLEPTLLGSYGNLVINKKIILISTGDFTSQNPGIQSGIYPNGFLDQIVLVAGSENSIISAKVNGYIWIEANNILITHSSCTYVSFGGYSGYPSTAFNTITKSIISSQIILYSQTADLILSNNVIGGIYFGATNSSAIITHNVIGLQNNGVDIYNSIVSNNIIADFGGGYTFGFQYCTVSDNISDGSAIFPVGSLNNTNSVDMSTVFTNWGAFNGDNYQLLPSYPNQNLGIFAGADPYKLACTPAVPSIYQFIAPATVVGNNLNITVSTKSNN